MVAGNSIRTHWFAVILAIGTGGAPSACSAQLALNAQGKADGFSLSTFVSGFQDTSFPNLGPTAEASTSAGNILVSMQNGDIYSFADADGQTVADALKLNSQFTITEGAPGEVGALALDRGTVYFAQSQKLYSLNNDGSVDALLLGGADVAASRLIANPVTGHLYSGTNIDPAVNLADIDPQSDSFVLHPAGGGGPLSVSLDGSELAYGSYPTVFAFSTSNFGTIWTSSTYMETAGTLEAGTFEGDFIGYSFITGDLYLFNWLNGEATLIGSGGLAGENQGSEDNIGMDANNDTLFIPQGDDILRLNETPVGVPEPGAAWVFAAIVLVVALVVRSRRPSSNTAAILR